MSAEAGGFSTEAALVVISQESNWFTKPNWRWSIRSTKKPVGGSLDEGNKTKTHWAMYFLSLVNLTDHCVRIDCVQKGNESENTQWLGSDLHPQNSAVTRWTPRTFSKGNFSQPNCEAVGMHEGFRGNLFSSWEIQTKEKQNAWCYCFCISTYSTTFFHKTTSKVEVRLFDGNWQFCTVHLQRRIFWSRSLHGLWMQ